MPDVHTLTIIVTATTLTPSILRNAHKLVCAGILNKYSRALYVLSTGIHK
jgi:hypothetical protein